MKQLKLPKKANMRKTECSKKQIQFQSLNRRSVVASFDGYSITSDAGLLLLREVNEKYRIIEQFADCFTDYRNPVYCFHTVYELLAQRVFFDLCRKCGLSTRMGLVINLFLEFG